MHALRVEEDDGRNTTPTVVRCKYYVHGALLLGRAHLPSGWSNLLFRCSHYDDEIVKDVQIYYVEKEDSSVFAISLVILGVIQEEETSPVYICIAICQLDMCFKYRSKEFLLQSSWHSRSNLRGNAMRRKATR